MILTKEKMFRKLTRNLNLLYVIAFGLVFLKTNFHVYTNILVAALFYFVVKFSYLADEYIVFYVSNQYNKFVFKAFTFFINLAIIIGAFYTFEHFYFSKYLTLSVMFLLFMKSLSDNSLVDRLYTKTNNL